jgi:hypothetical protein
LIKDPGLGCSSQPSHLTYYLKSQLRIIIKLLSKFAIARVSDPTLHGISRYAIELRVLIEEGSLLAMKQRQLVIDFYIIMSLNPV